MPKRVTLLLTASLAVPFLSACFGGSDSGNDESFVRALCEAQTELSDGIDGALAAASSQTDPQKTIDLLIPPLETYVDAFEDASPPDDLEAWHDASADQLESAVERFKQERTLASLEGFGDSPVPDPPAVQKQRLREAAADVEECNGVAFLKPD